MQKQIRGTHSKNKIQRRGSHWGSGAAGQAAVQQWPQIDSSASVQPASSSTQHPHCPLCQGANAALHSSGGCLRWTHYRYMLALAWPPVYCTERLAESRQREQKRRWEIKRRWKLLEATKGISLTNSSKKAFKTERSFCFDFSSPTSHRTITLQKRVTSK